MSNAPVLAPIGRATIFALASVWIVVMALTVDRWIYVWSDEVYFTDPAFSWISGEGFRSFCWQDCRGEPLFTSTAPLFSAMVAPWVGTVGLSPWSVRFFGVLIWAVGVIMLVKGLLRLDLLRTTSERWGVLAVLLGTYGCVFAYGSGRPEPVQLIILAIAAFGAVEQRWPVRNIVLFLCGALTPWVGVSAVALFGSYTVAVMLVFRAARIPAVVFLGGLGIGVLSVLGFHAMTGNLGEFVQMFTVRKTGGTFTEWLGGKFGPAAIRNHANNIPKDPSFYLIAAASALTFITGGGGFTRERKLILAAFLAMFLTYTGFKLSSYYTWFFLLTLSVPTLACLSQRAKWSLVPTALFLAAVFTGLPLIATVASGDWQERDYSEVDRWLREVLRPEDVIFADYAAYYGARKVGKEHFFEGYAPQLDDAQRARINVVVASRTGPTPNTAEGLAEMFGGTWSLHATRTPSRSGMVGNDYRWGILSGRGYGFTVWRREPGA